MLDYPIGQSLYYAYYVDQITKLEAITFMCANLTHLQQLKQSHYDYPRNIKIHTVKSTDQEYKTGLN